MNLLIGILASMTFLEYAQQFIGVRYVWGGNTPEQGFDCSGFVCEALRSQNYIGKEDLNSQGLYERFSKIGYASEVRPGSLLFFGSNLDSISHVSIALNKDQMLEAAGEGRQATDNGFVRVRHISTRKDLLAAINFENVYATYRY